MEIEQHTPDISLKKTVETAQLRELRLNRQYYFMKYLSPMQLTEYELEKLRIVEQTVHENEFINYYYETSQHKPALIPFDEKDRITKEDREPEWICIRGDTPMQELVLMIENLVYVTHFCYAFNGKRFIINLETFAVLLAKYGVEYSTDKFAKITLRCRDGPSHLFFGSGAMLETGAYNSIIARKSLNQTLSLLQLVCKFDNIQVSDRRCENIVAKGTLKFELCLHLLKDSYPSYVQYNTNTAGAFVGAIIRLRKIVTHQKKAPTHRPNENHSHRHHRKRDRTTDDEERDNKVKVRRVLSNDVNNQSINKRSFSDMKNNRRNNTNNNNNNNNNNNQYINNNDDSNEWDDDYDDSDEDDDEEEDDEYDEDEEEEEEEEDEDEIDQDENLDDYEFLEVKNNDIIYNTGFEHYNIPENIVRDEVDEAEIKAINAIASAGSQQNKRLKKRKKLNILSMVDPNNIDGFEPDENVKVKNITIIVFEKGRIICAGCKNTRSVYINCDKVRMMLYTCRKTPANLARERELKSQNI